MAAVLQPWQVFLAALAGWINRNPEAAIHYLREENRVLKQQLGRKRLRLTDAQRRRLAVRGKAVGRRALAEIAHSSLPTRSFVGTSNSSRRNGPTSDVLLADHGSWKSSPT